MKLHAQMMMMGYSQILDSYVASSRESGVFGNLVNRDPRMHIIVRIVSTWVSEYSWIVSTWVSEYSWIVSTWVSKYSWIVSTWVSEYSWMLCPYLMQYH